MYRSAAASPWRAAASKSLYCILYTPRNKCHHAPTPTTAGPVSHQACASASTPATAPIPLATIVAGWHHNGFAAHTDSGASASASPPSLLAPSGAPPLPSSAAAFTFANANRRRRLSVPPWSRAVPTCRRAPGRGRGGARARGGGGGGDMAKPKKWQNRPRPRCHGGVRQGPRAVASGAVRRGRDASIYTQRHWADRGT